MEAIQRHLFCKKRMFSVRPPTKFFLENKNVVLWINKSRNLGTWCLLFLERFPFHSFYSLSLSLFLSHRSFHSSEEKKKRRITQCFNQSKSKKKNAATVIVWNMKLIWVECFFLISFPLNFLIILWASPLWNCVLNSKVFHNNGGHIYIFLWDIHNESLLSMRIYLKNKYLKKKKKLKFSQLKHESYSAMRFHIVLKWFPHRLESNHYMLIACAQ